MQTNQVRIIGGKWRGRKLQFPNVKGLRPTPDRVRETLFNWLMPMMPGARCLDLFAGSGALGFEALSRGASEVVFVDQHQQVIEQLRANQQLLQSEVAKIYLLKAEEFLDGVHQPFDIVFLDPPFHEGAISSVCQLIADRQLVKLSGRVYLETGGKTPLVLPNGWKIIKSKQAGQVRYALATCHAVDIA